MRAVIESVAWDENKSTGVNVGKAKGSRPYFESAAVSLWSAKKSNPNWDVVLVTNTDIPVDISRVLESFGAKIVKQPFEKFSFPFDLSWHLAYYKLCALDALMTSDKYDALCLLDTDTWVRSSLDDLIEASGGGISMIDLHSTMNDADRKKMNADLEFLAIEIPPQLIPFYGGELLCGGKESLQSFLAGCSSVQKRMISCGHVSERGDEFLYYACLAENSAPEITSANAYAARCWTGRYYSVPRWEDLAVLHLPAEKVYSFPRAYKRLVKFGSVDPAWFERSCGLRLSRRPVSPFWLLKRSLDKVLQR